MRGKSMILIVIALGCGLVASIGISQILDRQGGGTAPKTQTKKIYVAVRDVDINQVLDADMIKLEEWPLEKVPEGAIANLDEVKGLATNQRLYAGEPVRKEKLIDPHQRGGDSLRIPKGYRVQAIRVTADAVAGNLIAPGDHVDVIVYLRQSGSIQQTMTKTILQDVRVFAVNSNTTRETDENGAPTNAKTVSLLLTPEQVETVLLASRLGQISLSLRRPDDDSPANSGDGKTPGDVLAGPAGSGTPKQDFFAADDTAKPAGGNNPADAFKKFLDGLGTSADPGASIEPDQLAQRTWAMDVLGPDGITTFEVVDDRQISAPQVKGSGTTNTSAFPVMPSVAPAVPVTTPDPNLQPPASVDGAGQSDSTDGSDIDDSTGFDPGA